MLVGEPLAQGEQHPGADGGVRAAQAAQPAQVGQDQPLLAPVQHRGGDRHRLQEGQRPGGGRRTDRLGGDPGARATGRGQQGAELADPRRDLLRAGPHRREQPGQGVLVAGGPTEHEGTQEGVEQAVPLQRPVRQELQQPRPPVPVGPSRGRACGRDVEVGAHPRHGQDRGDQPVRVRLAPQPLGEQVPPSVLSPLSPLSLSCRGSRRCCRTAQRRYPAPPGRARPSSVRNRSVSSWRSSSRPRGSTSESRSTRSGNHATRRSSRTAATVPQSCDRHTGTRPGTPPEVAGRFPGGGTRSRRRATAAAPPSRPAAATTHAGRPARCRSRSSRTRHGTRSASGTPASSCATRWGRSVDTACPSSACRAPGDGGPGRRTRAGSGVSLTHRP